MVSTHSRLKAAGRLKPVSKRSISSFNTQPPEGGWSDQWGLPICQSVSTHSRLKAAGPNKSLAHREYWVSTHSRLKAAGQTQARGNRLGLVSTHSRLKAAGYLVGVAWGTPFSFNTQPPEGGWVQVVSPHDDVGAVSTHSRLKAAGISKRGIGRCLTVVSTHSRLKAAGYSRRSADISRRFQHTAA